MRGGQEAPWASTQILGLFVVGALLMGVFLWWERRVPQPIVPIELFKLRTVSVANLAGFATGIGMFGTIMFVPLFVQGVLGGWAANYSLVLTPMMLALMVASVGSGQIITRTGRYRWALLARPGRHGHRLRAVEHARHGVHAGVRDGGDDRRRASGSGLLVQNLALVVQNAVPEPPPRAWRRAPRSSRARSAARSACR